MSKEAMETKNLTDFKKCLKAINPKPMLKCNFPTKYNWSKAIQEQPTTGDIQELWE